MVINLTAYRAAIGGFSGKSFCFSKSNILSKLIFLLSYFLITVINIIFVTLISPNLLLALPIRFCFSFLSSALIKHIVFAHFFKPLCFFWWLHIFSSINRILLIKAGIETNPGPSPPPRFSFATFNIDSLLARDECKLASIEGIDSVYKFDLFGICETYLNESISNSKLELAGFSPDPIRSDCILTDGRPRGGVCLFFKDHIPLKHRPDLEILEECIVCEILIKNKKFFYILIYRSPSQTPQIFSIFISKLQLLLDKINSEKPFSIILTGDFNARSPLFWDEESVETAEGKALSDLTLLNGLDQIINQPTHFPRPGIETCIDHIFTNQRNTIIDSGVIPSPDPCCKHSIIYGKINLSVPAPPPFKRVMWEYNKSDILQIRKSLTLIDWHGVFKDKTPDNMVDLFQTKFLATMNSFIPNKIVTINGRDAPWVTPEVKTVLRKNKRVYKRWVFRGRKQSEKALVNQTQCATNKIITNAKSRYLTNLGNKICDPNTGPKCFWTAFNKLLNKKKITNIPPLIENEKHVSCFKEKAGIFNKYFAFQCRPLESESSLPAFTSLTNERLSNISFGTDKIVDIINKLNSKKAHGFDGISIAMMKLCPNEVALPLSLIFKKCTECGFFPTKWKMANVQPVHKKNSRQTKSNYRPISLLPICSKIFEKIIFDSMYIFFSENDLLSKNQSGFRPGDSTINQLLSITTEIFNAFENFEETRAVFLDISKAFDKVWHEGLCFKLKRSGINGNLLKLISSFLSDRKQRVVLNGVDSEWEDIFSGVPQGSVLGPLLFLIYINDLTDNIISRIKLFADDSSLFIKVKDIEEAQIMLTSDLNRISAWAYQWKMKFNPDITKQAIEVIFSTKYKKENHPPLSFGGIPVARNDSTKHLGLHLDKKLSFKKHISEAIVKAKKGVSLLKFLSRYLNRAKLDLAFKLHVRPHLEYGDIIFHDRSAELMQLLESVQYQAGLAVTGCWQGTSKIKLYNELGWESLSERRKFHRLSLYCKILNNETPHTYLSTFLIAPRLVQSAYPIHFSPFASLNGRKSSQI